MHFDKVDSIKIPDNLTDILFIFERKKGSAQHLNDFLDNAQHNYDVAIKDLVYRPEFHHRIDYACYHSKNKPVLAPSRLLFARKSRILACNKLWNFRFCFSGAKPSNTPSFYSFMNYADFGLGTWHPKAECMKW